MDQQVEITILNWEKYNPKKMTTKTPFWFRLENNINRSESLSGLSKIDKWHWVCLLGIASKKKSGTFVCDLRWLSVELMLRPRQIIQALHKFFGKNLLEFELKTHDLGAPEGALLGAPYKTEQNNIVVVEEILDICNTEKISETGITTTENFLEERQLVIKELEDFPEPDLPVLKLLTLHGQKTYLQRFGSKYKFHQELKDCHLRWESLPAPKQPFITALSNWYKKWQAQQPKAVAHGI